MLDKEALDAITETFKQRIEEALVMFGTYTFEDKGPQEVMDLDDCIADLEPLDMEEVATVLIACLKHPRGDSFGRRFVGAILMELQHMPEEDFDVLMAHEELAAQY